MSRENADAIAELFYTLCPNDPRCKAYFKLTPELQQRVMHGLLLDVTKFAGGGNLKKGVTRLKRWQGLTISLPVINGHAFMTEPDGQSFIADRVGELNIAFGGTESIAIGIAPCPNCVPKPDYHESVRIVTLLENGQPALARFKLGKRATIVVPIFLRIGVLTEFKPLSGRAMRSMGGASASRGLPSVMLDPTPRRSKSTPKKPAAALRAKSKSR